MWPREGVRGREGVRCSADGVVNCRVVYVFRDGWVGDLLREERWLRGMGFGLRRGFVCCIFKSLYLRDWRLSLMRSPRTMALSLSSPRSRSLYWKTLCKALFDMSCSRTGDTELKVGACCGGVLMDDTIMWTPDPLFVVRCVPGVHSIQRHFEQLLMRRVIQGRGLPQG